MHYSAASPNLENTQIEKSTNLEIKVSPKNIEDDNSRIMWGTMRALINNAVIGASVGFAKTLEFKGVGYKIALKGNKLDMVLGFSHNVEYDLPAEVKAEYTADVGTKQGEKVENEISRT